MRAREINEGESQRDSEKEGGDRWLLRRGWRKKYP
jgi:hypothetical protein